jgi:hypothetical protein
MSSTTSFVKFQQRAELHNYGLICFSTDCFLYKWWPNNSTIWHHTPDTYHMGMQECFLEFLLYWLFYTCWGRTEFCPQRMCYAEFQAIADEALESCPVKWSLTLVPQGKSLCTLWLALKRFLGQILGLVILSSIVKKSWMIPNHNSYST